MQLLSSANMEQLEAQGFGISELTGFDDHSMPLFTHRPIGDKQPGDVVVRARIGNPDALDDGEATYLARKAFHGLFPWLPGAECVKRSFFDVTIPNAVTAGGTGQPNRSEKAFGCKWCRKSKPTKTRKRRGSTAKSASDLTPSNES